MTLGIFCAVLAAALLHVLWNSLIRNNNEKNLMMLMIVIAQGLVGIPFILLNDIPDSRFWGWITASTFIHVLYQMFLIRAYHYGDLSRVYPIARGAAPMFVLMMNPILLHEALSFAEVSGILAIGVGIALLSFGAWQQKETLRLIPLALCAALCTAAYSIVDGLGARMMGDAFLYKSWVVMLDACIWVGFTLLMNRASFARLNSTIIRQGLMGGTLSFSAYAIVLWAITQAPIALVTALRETSVLLAVLVGVMFFKEKMEPAKLIAAAIILSGVALAYI